MKIGIDVSQVIYGTGVSTYTEGLVKNLLDIDKKNEYVLFGSSLRRSKELENFYHSLKGNFKGIAYPLPPTFLDFIWNRLHRLNVERLIGPVDIYHSSDWTQPPTKAFKVTTIHDLVSVLYPEWSDPIIVSVNENRLMWVRKDVDAIISVSESTKRDLVELGFKSKKIFVVPEAVDEKLFNENVVDEPAVLKKHGLTKKYLLAVGVTKRKNINNIMKAFVKINKIMNRKFQLAVVGHKYTDKFDFAAGVKFLGSVDKNDLPALYSGAEVLVYPSLYEGFGLPILESMACGTPVVTSNVSSMKEVAGDAAVLVDPKSVESIKNGIKRAIGDGLGLKKKGLERAKDYSWEKTAHMTLKIYNNFL
jgi:glycosyltransferase involved in cell wall biosynthesis